jgi:hypothetical protein
MIEEVYNYYDRGDICIIMIEGVYIIMIEEVYIIMRDEVYIIMIEPLS